MDTETVSPNFDDIRPLNNSEVKGGILSCHACLQDEGGV